eukprot:g36659.t1
MWRNLFASASVLKGFSALSTAPKFASQRGIFPSCVTSIITSRTASGSVAAQPDNRLLTDKLYKPHPYINSQRGLLRIDRSELWKGRPVKELTRGMRSTGGRGRGGQICTRHRGGGHKRRYRIIDFRRDQKLDVPATVYQDDKSVSYIVAADGMTPGMEIISTRKGEVPVKIGNCMPLANIPIGTVIHLIEMIPGKGAQIARAAGTYGELLDKRSRPGYGLVKMRSLEQRYFPLKCAATIGTVSNPLANREKLGKAGRSRWLGIRPYVRGVAMNPVDHPMGGGEGKSSGGRCSCGPTGILSKGFKTRKRDPHKNVLITRFKARMMKRLA